MTLIVHKEDNQLIGEIKPPTFSQTNLSFLHLVFYTKQELRVVFPSTKSESKSKVNYFLKWQSSSSTLSLRNSCYCSPLTGAYWLLKKKYFPSPDSHLLLNFLFFSKLGIAIVYQVPMAKTICP